MGSHIIQTEQDLILEEAHKILSNAKIDNMLISMFDGDFKNFKVTYKYLYDDMLSKLTQLQRKHNESCVLNQLIEDYGHKVNSLLNKDVSDFRTVAENYCIIRMCMYNWGLNKEPTNIAINRIVKVLYYVKTNDPKRYSYVNDFIWNSEWSFRREGEYGRLALYFPFQDKELTNLTDEQKLVVFRKAEGLHTGFLYEFLNDDIDEGKYQLTSPNYKLPTKCSSYFNYEDYVNKLWTCIESKVKSNFSYIDIWNALSKQEKDDITIIVNYTMQRNRAIFIMLLFQLHGSLRQRYSRESDRIVSSDFFRYLQYKSQVMINSASDNQRTRLVHSLEVAGLAKLIAKQLGCNWELTETISLGHDLGHVPFGHSGEDALDMCLYEAWAGRFSHSLQSVKVADHLAHHATLHEHFGVNGLCLSRPVLEGILKHDTDNLFHDIKLACWRLQYNDWRDALIDDSEWVNGLCLGNLESQIAYWADKIAYAGHDWDELAKSGIIEKITRDVEHILKRMHQVRHVSHARIGGNGSKVLISEVKNEIDLIRFVRYYIEKMGDKLSRGNTDSFSGENIYTNCIIAAFRPYESPLAEFVNELKSKEYNKAVNSTLALKYFTKDEYKLVFDFFTIASEMIQLTKTYPRPYKRSDDVLWVLCRYLTEIDNRSIVRALQNDILKFSRAELVEKNVSNGQNVHDLRSRAFLRKTSKYFKDTDINTLDAARKYTSMVGRVKNTDTIKRGNLKDLKKWFRENMQNKMLIRLSEETMKAHDGINKFVFDYYIGSDHVRIMKHKAQRIIKKLFEFFMNNEDMLPIASRHWIESNTQKLLGAKGDFVSVDPSSDIRFLVVRYVAESLIQEKREIFENMKKDDIASLCRLERFFICHLKDLGKLPDDKKYTDLLKEIESEDNIYQEYISFCRYIAKARIVADYIATMTDRYAEKKYNEIMSSSVSWSLSYRE